VVVADRSRETVEVAAAGGIVVEAGEELELAPVRCAEEFGHNGEADPLECAIFKRRLCAVFARR
jgi:hypothetical protein